MRSRTRDPLSRLLIGTANALRARRGLPRRDPRRTGSLWVRPNWPDALLLGVHRNRLVEALMQDAALREEVRDLLRLPRSVETPSQLEVDDGANTDISDRLAAAMAAATDPVAILEAAATDPDAALSAAASPYLRGELLLPAAVPQPTSPPGRPEPTATDRTEKLRARAREAERTAKSLRRELRDRQNEIADLTRQLSTATGRAENAENNVTKLQGLVPSPRERDALASASSQSDKLDELRGSLDRERSARRAEVRTLRELVAETEAALERSQAKLDSEARGRHRLEAALGEDAGGRAGRLVPLAAREAAKLRDGAEGMPTGPGKTKQTRRAKRLDDVVAALRDLYCLNATGDPDAEAGISPDTMEPHRGLMSQVRARGLTVTPVGGANRIGGSALLVEAGETRLLVVWADSVRVMRADTDAVSTRTDRFEPPYGDAEVEQAEGRLKAARFGQTVSVRDLELTLFRAGHILGAAGVVIRAGDQRVVVTGDIDDRGQASIGPAQIPRRLADGADLLVIETTYCDRLHSDRRREGDDLVRQAEEILNAGGRVLIPAFGLGRAQEVALLLGDRLPDVDVLVDGIARDISDLYARNGAPEVLRGRVRKVQQRDREIRGFSEGIIITTSGMLTGGAAIPWAQAILPEPGSALFLCGHQDEESPGRDLQELADADPERPRCLHLRDDHGRPVQVDVAASVHTYNLSAHADRTGLMAIVNQVRPQVTMLVHGESGPQALFRDQLNTAGHLVASNQAPWDADTVIADPRRARTRHAARSRGRRG